MHDVPYFLRWNMILDDPIRCIVCSDVVVIAVLEITNNISGSESE